MGRKLAISILIVVIVAWISREIHLERSAVHYHATVGFFLREKPYKILDELQRDIDAPCVHTTNVSSGERVYIGKEDPNIVHVHDNGVTWAHLMDNLGFHMGKDFLFLNHGRQLFSHDEFQLHFVLNGQIVDEVHTLEIMPDDKLMIHYGSGDDGVQIALYDRLAHNASAFENINHPDPCHGLSAKRAIVRFFVLLVTPLLSGDES